MRVQIVGHVLLYGYEYGGWTGGKSNIEEAVATFDSRKDAVTYIKKSRLKSPKDYTRPFRQKSLLSGFGSARVEVLNEEGLIPHNPEV